MDTTNNLLPQYQGVVWLSTSTVTCVQIVLLMVAAFSTWKRIPAVLYIYVAPASGIAAILVLQYITRGTIGPAELARSIMGGPVSGLAALAMFSLFDRMRDHMRV